jgi:hypothetical protein
VQFPASKNQLISNASAQGADSDVLSFLDMIEDREYSSLEDLLTEMEMGEEETETEGLDTDEAVELGEVEEL